MNSGWFVNASKDCTYPYPLTGYDLLEVEYAGGGGARGPAHAWRYSWNTNCPDHITKYRLITKEEEFQANPCKEVFPPDVKHEEPSDERSVAKVSETQVGGTHYVSLTIQPWDAMESWLTPEQFKGYLLGSAIKYLGRFNAEAENKGGMVDVKKAIQFLNKLVEVADV